MKGTHSHKSECSDCAYSVFKDVASARLDPEIRPGTKIDVAACSPGDGSCTSAGGLVSPMATEERTFHPDSLREATHKINKILKKLTEHAPAGRDLSFLRTPRGMMLAWTHQDIPIKAGAVTSASSARAIMRGFGLVSGGW